MGLTEDLQAKRPGEWTQEDIRGLQHKYKRTHFDHFKGPDVKLKRLKNGSCRRVNGTTYIWMNGEWHENRRS